MKLKVGDNFLVTTDAWFLAPDGRKYQAVWGTLNAIKESKDTLGIKTNAKSTNWYVVIGNMVIAGCQIHYAIKCDSVNFNKVEEIQYSPQGVQELERQCEIYNANE